MSVGYSCISGSLNCALGYVGTSRAKTSGVDLHARLCDRLCACVSCLRYPRKGISPRVYYYYNHVIRYLYLGT